MRLLHYSKLEHEEFVILSNENKLKNYNLMNCNTTCYQESGNILYKDQKMICFSLILNIYVFISVYVNHILLLRQTDKESDSVC